MFANLLDFYTKLPEWVKASPAITLLLLGFVGFLHGDLVAGRTYTATVEEKEQFKTIAFRCVGIVTDTAQKVATAVEQPREAKPAAPKLTESEKQSITQPTSAEPATLSQKLEETKKVLAKIEPTPTPGKKE